MATRKPTSATQPSTAVTPEAVERASTPAGVMFGSGEHSFTLQAIMELQKSVGEMNANMSAMKSSLDGMKTKIDDLVGWKHKILGGAAAIAAVIAVLAFILGKASEYITLKQPPAQTVINSEKISAPTPAPAVPQSGKQ